MTASCACPPTVLYACGHCWHDTCLDCGQCAATGCLCHCEFGFTPAEGPSAGPHFYLGAKPHFFRYTDVPLFVADPHLRSVRTLPRARGPWALDSGGFTQLSEHGTWDSGPSPQQYVAQIRRYTEEIGRLEWAAPQDWMCEDVIIHGGPMPGGKRAPGTHLSVAEHLRRTVTNFLELRTLAADLPIVPVVQGGGPDDYERCVEMYDRAGVDLTREPVVGVGSVCRIQATTQAAEIIHRVSGILGPDRLHGFGFKTEGLRRVGHLLGSADSMAWSAQGRHTPALDCDFRLPRSRGPHKNEANCLRFALGWRERVVSLLAHPRPRQLDLWEAA